MRLNYSIHPITNHALSALVFFYQPDRVFLRHLEHSNMDGYLCQKPDPEFVLTFCKSWILPFIFYVRVARIDGGLISLPPREMSR